MALILAASAALAPAMPFGGVVEPAPAPAAPPVVMLRAPFPPAIHFINLPPPPTELPASIRDLAAAAFEARDDDGLRSILKLARHTNPRAAAQIEAIEADYSARRAEEAARKARERAESLAAASFLDNWRGEVELGGTRSTGNSKSIAIYGAIRFEREGLKWRNLINGRVDFQRTEGTTTADRWKLGWEPNYKVDDTLFVYGLSQYERDRFAGFQNRYTVSSGVGWSLLSTPRTTLTIQGGPAVRYTDYVDRDGRATAAGRASMGLRWKISPTLTFTQDAAVYLEERNNNAMSTTTLETRLIGALKARLSYDLQYEEGELTGRRPLDTTSRATFVYSF